MIPREADAKQRLIATLIAGLIRLLGLTLRVRVTGREPYFSGVMGGQYVFVFWHNRVAAMPVVYRRFYSGRKGAIVLTSASKDGALLAEVVRKFKIGSERGSSSRRGAEALRRLCQRIEQGWDVIITPDGPRGPCYNMGAGPVFLAQKTGAVIVPLHISYSRCIRLKSWDRFMVPLPFARIDVRLDDPVRIPRELTPEQFEQHRASLETRLRPVE